MSTNPWMKFYPRDWRGDQALRAVSIAARGLWIECLCIMHEAKPYGHLLLNGGPVGDGTLARMAGTTADEAAALMAELEQAGVFSRTREGVVFSRRMAKDYGRALKGKKAVKKRWSQASENKEKSGEPNRSPNRSPITQKPEARGQNTPKPPRGPDKPGDDQIEKLRRLWPTPRRASKAVTEKKILIPLREGFSFDQVFAAARRWLATQDTDRDGGKFCKGMEPWFNQRIWADWLEESGGSDGEPEADPKTAQVQAFIKSNSQTWPSAWGRRPDDPRSDHHAEWLRQTGREVVSDELPFEPEPKRAGGACG